MFVTRTPLAIDGRVRNLCDQIRPGVEPEYVRIDPGADDQISDCFNNVRRRVDQAGGDIVFGWAIWEWPRVFVEAEHHAVWAPPGGASRRDITPAADPTFRRRLFLADDKATYDFASEGVLRDNVRLAISEAPIVEAMFAAAAERVAVLNSIPGIGQVRVDYQTGRRIDDASMQVMQLQYETAMTHTPARGPCFCGKPKMFKQCHGRS